MKVDDADGSSNLSAHFYLHIAASKRNLTRARVGLDWIAQDVIVLQIRPDADGRYGVFDSPVSAMYKPRDFIQDC